MTNTKTEEVIAQAISDLDDIESAIEDMGVDVPYDTDTKEYGNIIRDMVQSKTAEAYDEGYAKGAEENSGGGINPEWTSWRYFSYENNRNELIDKIKYNDTSNGTDFSNMFQGCSNLTSVPLFDTSNGIKFFNMFGGCKKLTSVPQYDTSNATDINSMFQNCFALTTVPQLETGNVTNFYNMFIQCSALKSVPLLDTSKGTQFLQMFSGCRSLVTIPEINMSNATSISSTFAGCQSLENITFVGTFPIKANTTVFNNSSKLTVDSLMSFINALTNTGTATYTVTIGSTNLAKLTDEQKAIATAKNIKLA